MASYDSLINVDEWISEHFFTTDETKGESFTKSVKARVKEWKDLEKETGSVSPAERFKKARGELQNAYATADQEAALQILRRAVGYGTPTQRTYERATHTVTYSGWAGADDTLLVLEAEPIDDVEDITTTPVAGGITQKDREPETFPVAKLVGELFLTDDAPEFIVILAGPWAVLANRETWALGRYLGVNVQLVVERNEAKQGGEMQRAAVILARQNVERAADGTTWWSEVLESARNHAVKVSEDLRDAVRESIELIGNDVLERRKEQGLPLEEVDGNELARQSLRYLYRILFLLFAEASPELQILPTDAAEYADGYGLGRLRDYALTPPLTEQARRGTHLYDSLQILFDQVNHGHHPELAANADEDAQNEGLTFRNLEADLFKPEATSLLSGTKLSNHALTEVLQRLLLSKEKAGRDRGFISYATLGVTELGQVYEGLMSYHGFIAQEDLYEVAPGGNAAKGSWVLPVGRASTVPQDSFVMEMREQPEGGYAPARREHKRGSFVFRQSSRDRERSASFYTPEVLTQFTVGQALEVLEEEGRIQTAEDILDLTICEPAMGSGAFAVEAVRQLADRYLKLREAELGEQVPPEHRTRELQKIKAHIALHQVYGVDLNPTAVELAEISLWLDTMTGELTAPLVRPPPAPRQLAHRCPALNLRPLPAEKEGLAYGRAAPGVRGQSRAGYRRRPPRPPRRRPHPPLPAALPDLGRGPRGEGFEEARRPGAKGARCLATQRAHHPHQPPKEAAHPPCRPRGDAVGLRPDAHEDCGAADPTRHPPVGPRAHAHLAQRHPRRNRARPFEQ